VIEDGVEEVLGQISADGQVCDGIELLDMFIASQEPFPSIK
jgi:hypothetical protein